MAGSSPARFRLRFDLRRAWSANRRSWRCHVAFGDEPLGLHRHRPLGGHTAEGGFVLAREETDPLEEAFAHDDPPNQSSPSTHQYSLYQYSLRTRRQVGRPRLAGPETDREGFADHLQSRGTDVQSRVMGEGLTVQRWMVASRSMHAEALSAPQYASSQVPIGGSVSSLSEGRLSEVGDEPPFPCRPDQLSCDWLTELLQDCGVVPSHVAVCEFDSERMGEGVGLLSLLHRLYLHYNEDPGSAAPKTLVAKFGHPSPEVRRMAQANGSYEREVGLYSLLGTRCADDVARDQSPSALALRTPAVYFCKFHAPSGQMAVVMEDLAGIRQLDQIRGATLAQAAAVVRDTARSHAEHWNSPELDQQPWLPKMSEERFKAFDPGEYPASWPVFLKLFGGTVPGSAKRALEALPQYCPALLDLLGARPRTLLHGDLRLDNVYQVHDGDSVAEPAADGGEQGQSKDAEWQSAVASAKGIQLLYMDFGDCCAGRGPADVAYFLSQSLHSDIRRAHEERLVRLYWETLNRECRDRETRVGKPASHSSYSYSWDECWEDYRRAVLYYWVLAVNVSAHVGEGRESSRVARLAQVMSQRSLAALLDLRCLDVLKGLELRKTL